MKKKLFIALIAVFVFIPFVKVNALELTQTMIDDACTNTPDTDIGGLVCHIDGEDREITLLSGTHSLSEDVAAYAFQAFDADGNTILNLNNHTLTGEIIVSYNNSLTINGPGTVTGSVVAEQGNITINGGTYNNGITMLLGKLIITDATVDSGSERMAVAIMDLSETTISGGTYTGTIAGVGVAEEGGYGNIKSITISGGTFTGGMTGLMLYSYDIDSIKLSGGTFTGGLYSILAVNDAEAKANTIFNDILADGYTYSPAMTFTTEYDGDDDIWASYTNQKELSVVQDTNSTPTPEETTNPSEDTTTSNPATGDNIFLYITLVALSLAGLTGAGFYIKNKIIN